MSRSEPVGIAVVGAGGWGKNHVRNYSAIPEADLRYVCDHHDGIRSEMAALYPGVSAVTDLRVVLDDPSVSAVVVATHAPSHFEVAEAALRAGRDVFVEKPLCLSGDQAASSVCACRARSDGSSWWVTCSSIIRPSSVSRASSMTASSGTCCTSTRNASTSVSFAARKTPGGPSLRTTSRSPTIYWGHALRRSVRPARPICSRNAASKTWCLQRSTIPAAAWRTST